MLDTVTLRVVFGIIAFSVLVLFYAVTYRTTRSAFSAWWCGTLACFLASSLLFLPDGTAMQVVANPLGNATGVGGAACMWAAASTLRGVRRSLGLLLAGPAAVLVASMLEHPDHNAWSGGWLFLLGMAVGMGLSSIELWRLRAEDGADRVYAGAVTVLACASGLGAVFYLARWIAYLAVGPHAPLFVDAFGTQTSTLIVTVMFTVVTFSMSSLSSAQQTAELRRLARHDALTGLLNRAAFLEQARGIPGAVLMVDLDEFKQVNDGFGHDVGDAALETFARACRQALPSWAVLARWGGEEFAVLLAGESAAGAARLAARLRSQFAAVAVPGGPPSLTASVGVATTDGAESVELAITRADAALYRAKRAGRDRIEVDPDSGSAARLR